MTDTTSDETTDDATLDKPDTRDITAASQSAESIPPAPEPSPPDLGISVSDISETEDGLR